MKLARRSRGVSLVEALIALAVMAFGMLGLVGLQSSMRTNADLAKQRAEATRIAQERIENMRSYGSLAEYGAVVADVAEAAAAGPATTNTSYNITTQVTPDVLPTNRPPLRTAVVTVEWTDRANQRQSVSLATQVAGVAPALTGGMSTDGYGTPARRVLGRNAGISQRATDQGDGTSRFTPPSTSTTWVFNNATGVVTKVCNTATNVCTAANLVVISGFVTFSVETRRRDRDDDDKVNVAPTPADTEVPPSAAPFTVQLQGTFVNSFGSGTVNCFSDWQPSHVAYWCPMPLFAGNIPNDWTGRIDLVESGSFDIADDSADDHDNRYRVCRFTPEDTDTPTGGNPAHPRSYSKVVTSLSNQNFLIIWAGDGDRAFSCPDDGPSTFLNTNTYAHQPPASP